MLELDLHGVRFHEAPERLLAFVDQAFLNGHGCCRIIHGHGTMAGHIAKWLSKYPHITKIEPDPTNTGATIVYL